MPWIVRRGIYRGVRDNQPLGSPDDDAERGDGESRTISSRTAGRHTHYMDLVTALRQIAFC